jgi:hypothetical protein
MRKYGYDGNESVKLLYVLLLKEKWSVSDVTNNGDGSYTVKVQTTVFLSEDGGKTTRPEESCLYIKLKPKSYRQSLARKRV